MQSKCKTYFNWSTGKDSAFALYRLLSDENYSVEKLLTSVNSDYDRVSMHGIRRSLLDKQINAIGIPYDTIELPENASMKLYEEVITKAVDNLKSEGYTTAAFGDIFLEDLRQYREKQLEKVGIASHFPIWKTDTTTLLQEFIDLGFKAIVVACNAQLLDASFAGRTIDHSFLNDLPENVDPCGENGEFHTFCYDGPIFKNPIAFEIGEKVYREYESPSKEEEKMGFWFCDLIPV